MGSLVWPRLIAACLGGVAFYSSPLLADTWSGSYTGTSGPQWVYWLDVENQKVSVRAWGELNGARYPIVCDQARLDASGKFQTTCQHAKASPSDPLGGVRFGLKARLAGTSATMSYAADNGGKASLQLTREVAELVRPDNVVTNNAPPPAATSTRPLATPAPQTAPPSGPSVMIKPQPAPETLKNKLAEALPVPPKPEQKKVEVEKPKPVEDKIALKSKEPEPPKPQPKKETVDSIVDGILKSEDARTKSQKPAAQSDGLRKELPPEPELSGQAQAQGVNASTSKPTLSKTTPAPATARVDISDLNIAPNLCNATVLSAGLLGIGAAEPAGTFCEFASALRNLLKDSNEQLLPLQTYTRDKDTLVGLPMRQRGSDDVTCVFRDVRGDLVLEGALDERSRIVSERGTLNCLMALSSLRKPSTETPPKNESRRMAPELGSIATVSEMEGVRRKIRPCWTSFGGDKAAPVVTLVIQMDQTGTPTDAQFKEPSRLSDPIYRAAAEAARRAVLNPRCQPWPLPAAKYQSWQSLTLHFDPRDY